MKVNRTWQKIFCSVLHQILNDSRFVLVWFDLVSLFNGIAYFMGYLMPKQSLEKNSNGTISTITGGIRGLILFERVWSDLLYFHILISRVIQVDQLLMDEKLQSGNWVQTADGTVYIYFTLLCFHHILMPLRKAWIHAFSLQLWINSRVDWVLWP